MGPPCAVIPLQPSDKRSHAACARASISRPMRRACVVGHLRFRDVNEANYETLNAAAAAPFLPTSFHCYLGNPSNPEGELAKATRGLR